jgi:predicted dehydrogenase
VLGLLANMEIKSWAASSANIFANGRGTSATMTLNGGQALCHLAHVVVPKLADYQERISLFFEDRRFELIFPSPYLHNYPTKLLEYTSEEYHLQKTEHRADFHESFVRELEGFWRSIAEGAPVRNTPEEARLDMRLVRDFMALALAARQNFDEKSR